MTESVTVEEDSVVTEIGARIAAALLPRVSMMNPFPRLELLSRGHGVKALFPRFGLLAGWY